MLHMVLLILALQAMPGVPDHYVARKGTRPRPTTSLPAPAQRLVTARVLNQRTLDSLAAIRECSGADLEWAIAHAFEWRPGRGATPEAWRSEARSRLGSQPRQLDLATVAAACESAARLSGYVLSVPRDSSFRRSLRTGMAEHGGKISGRMLLDMVANARFPLIRILETTDFHGALLPLRGNGTGAGSGGAATLAAHIRRLRAENPEGTVLLDGGDMFQGTMISNLSFGRSVVEHMNLIGYTAAAIGNHEFDWGVDTLVRRIQEMRFAALGANIRERSSQKRPAWARADTVVVRCGVRIGILGLSFPRTPSVTLARHVAALQFDDDVKTAQRFVPDLRKRSDIVVGVGHIPARAGKNRELAGGDLADLLRVEGVSAWFGGHSHNEIVGMKEAPAFAIAGSHGRCVAVCDLVVDPIHDRVISRKGALLPTTRDVPPDSATAALVTHWNREVGPLSAAPLGRSTRRLERNRDGESPLGSFVADAIREVSGCDIAFQNSGGLRADLAAGVVTRGALYEVMPFDNTIVKLDLTGADVKLALEQALATGRVTQVSGIRYVFDNGSPKMQRVTQLTLDNGRTLDEARVYSVAVNNFMATGGDDYRVFRNAKSSTETGVLVRDAMERLVMKLESGGKTLDYGADGRITAAR